MKFYKTAWIAITLCVLGLSQLPEASAQAPIQIAKITRSTPVSFQTEVLPILRKNCLACHSASEADGELVLESPQAMLKGGDTGPAIVAGKGAESLLIHLASRQDEPAMPPPGNDVAAKALTPQELGLIKLWIDQGAKGLSSDSVLSPTAWRTLPEGPNPVYAVAVTPDGQFAACSRANQIFIYHVPTGQLITRLTDESMQTQSKDKRPGIAHLDVVQSLAFNRQGDRLASGGFRTAKIWRYPRDVQRLTIEAATDTVNSVAVSPNKELIATGAADNTIKVWKADTGEAVSTLAGHTDAVTSLHFSHDSTKLYSASLDKSILVWNLEDGQLAGRIVTPAPVNAITTVHKPLPASTETSETSEPDDTSSETVAEQPEPQFVEMLVSGGDNVVRLWNVPDSLPQSLADNLPKANVVAVSPDRKWLAMANAAGQVQVRDLTSGEIKKSWQAHEAAVHALAFAPAPEKNETESAEPEAAASDDAAEDDAAPPAPLRLATASADSSVKIWNASSGLLLTSLRGSLTAVDSLAFRKDGLRLVAGAADGGVTEWNLDSEPTNQLATQTQPATVAAVSPDGKLIATGDVSNGRPAIIVRDLATGNTTDTLLGHSGTVTSLAFSADNTRLVSGSEDKTARVWDLSDAKFPEVVRFTGHSAVVRAVAFNPDATQVLSGADDNSLKLWAVADGSETVDFKGHSGPVVGVAMVSATQAISASADKTIRVWNAANGQAVRSTADTGAINALTVSRDNARLAVATPDNKVKIYQVSNGQLLQTLEGHASAVHSLAFSADNTRLVTADATDAFVWRIEGGRLLEIISQESPWSVAAYGPASDTLLLGDARGALHQRTLRFSAALGDMNENVTTVAYRADGQVVFTASTDGTIRGFNLADGRQLFAANHGAAVHQLALRSDGQMLASAGEDKQVKLWNAANGAALAPTTLAGFTGPVRTVAFVAAGKKIVATSNGETPEAFVFGLPDGKLEQVLTGSNAAVESLATTGVEEDRLIASTADGTAAVWQLVAVRRAGGHTKPITSLATVNELQVISGSEDGTLRRWNLAADSPVVASLNHGAPITGVAVRPDGERLASASSNKTVKLWNAANNGQLAEMKGDLRTKALVAKLTRQKTDWTAKVAAAKKTLADAEKDLPTKTQAEKTAATTLAAAEKEVNDKSAALAKASTAKSQAEQIAIKAAASAQAATKKMEAANQLALNVTAQATLLAEKAAQARAVAQAEPMNEQLAKLAADMTTAAEAADAEAKKAMAAKAQPTQAAQAASQQAATAATKAVQMAKPFTDASTALTQAQAALKTAKQLHNSAVRDLKAATDAVPAAKAQLTKAEAALKQTETDLAAAVSAETDAQLPFRCVQFSPDGRTLASGGDMGVVHTWDADSGKAVNSYVGHAGPVQSLAYVSEDELVTGSADKKAAVWNLNPSWELERVIGDISDPSILIDRVVAVDFSQDGRLLATGGGVPSRSGEVKIWSVEDGLLVHSLPDAHTDGVNAVAFSPDDQYLASAGADKFVKKWDVATGKQLLQFEGHTSHVLGVSWRANGQRLASSGADARIQIWNALTGDRVRNIAGYNKQVTAVRYVGQTQFIVSTSGDKIVRMHNSDNGGVQRNFAGATDYMYCIDVTPDTSVVVAGGHDGVLRIWNGADAQVVQTIGPPKTDEELASNP